MDKIELNDRLRRNAISCGLCAQWQNDWKKDWDLDMMISQFYRGLDFFLDKRFISNDFIKENFERDFLRKNGILVDDTYSLLNPREAILIGESQSTIRCNAYNATTLYIIDSSKAKIIAKNNAAVMVRLLGKAQVEIQQHDKAKVSVINHSKDSVIISDDKITVREDFDFLNKSLYNR